MSTEHRDDDPEQSGEYVRNRWGRAVRANASRAAPRSELESELIERIHAPEVRKPTQAPAWTRPDYKPPRRQRPRIKHAFGKEWISTGAYLPEPGVPVRLKFRNRGLGFFDLEVLEPRGFQWRDGDRVLESHQVTHWRYNVPKQKRRAAKLEKPSRRYPVKWQLADRRDAERLNR